MSGSGQQVTYSRGGNKLIVVTNPGSVLAFRAGKLGWNRVLQVDQVFTNVIRGDVASAAVLSDVFGTENIEECCKTIVQDGELQLTTAERRQMVNEKRREIISYINKNWVNPQTQLPHPIVRIEGAVSKVRFIPDPNREARPQAEALVKKLQGQIMFTKAVALRAQLTLKHEYVGQLDNTVNHIANVTGTDWTATGCTYTLELSRSDMDRLVEALSKPTQGDYDFRVLQDGESATPPVEDTGGKKKKKKKKKKRRENANDEPSAADAPAPMNDSSGKKKKKKKRRDDSSNEPSEASNAPPPAQEEDEVPARKKKKKRKRRKDQE